MEGVSRTRQGRRSAAAARLLALLAVVLGLLGMHGLASTHHAAAAPGHAPSAVAAFADQSVMPEDRAAPQQHDHAAARARAVTAIAGSVLGEAVIGPAVPGCEDDCPNGLAVLCAAVLAAAAATAWLIAATARRRVPAARDRVGPLTRTSARARRLIARLDPVAQLCVSRT